MPADPVSSRELKLLWVTAQRPLRFVSTVVGLPVVRPKATADTLLLDALYRNAAGKAGITYVDVWDGFVDEAGRFPA